MPLDLSLYLVTDYRISWEASLQCIRNGIEGGVTAVQLREKGKPVEEVRKNALALKHLLDPLGVPLIINDFLEVTRDVEAAGVHLGGADVTVKEARKFLGPDFRIGISVSSLSEMNEAPIDLCDYISASPVFPSFTKKDAAPPLGIEGLEEIRANCELPLVAIGGIHTGNAGLVCSTGVDGICVVSAIFQSEDPFLTASELKLASAHGMKEGVR